MQATLTVFLFEKRKEKDKSTTHTCDCNPSNMLRCPRACPHRTLDLLLVVRCDRRACTRGLGLRFLQGCLACALKEKLMDTAPNCLSNSHADGSDVEGIRNIGWTLARSVGYECTYLGRSSMQKTAPACLSRPSKKHATRKHQTNSFNSDRLICLYKRLPFCGSTCPPTHFQKGLSVACSSEVVSAQA